MYVTFVDGQPFEILALGIKVSRVDRASESSTAEGESMPRPEKLELTPEEQGLLDQMDFGPPYEHGQAAAARLAVALLSRDAIPEARLRWLDDPSLHVGMKMSRRELLEKNGLKGMDLLTDGVFLPYLHYFIFGPNLPSDVIAEFCAKVDQYPFVSGSVRDALVKIAKDAVRRCRLSPGAAAEEFWKLATECGVDNMHARSIRDAVLRVRSG
jgi:hypothetical protein